jgi:hypothetical protein
MPLTLLSYSPALFALFGVCTLAIGVYGYLHARRYWEGLPPVLDAFVSMVSFVAIVAAFVLGERLGVDYGHPHAARLLAVTVVLILSRAIRTWIGKEQIRYRAARARKPEEKPD